MCSASELFLLILAIIFPPVAVWIKTGICTAESFINICLCILGYLPGLLHAWYIICKYPESGAADADTTVDSERQTITHEQYYIVPAAPYQDNPESAPLIQAQSQSQQQRHQQPGVTYYYVASGQKVQPISSAPEGQAGQSRPAHPTAGQVTGSALPPPSYAQAVQGDHKIQR